MWPFWAGGHVKKSETRFLKIFCTHVPTSWRHVRNICPSSAKSICYFSVCHWVISQGSTLNNRGARGGVATPGRAPLLLCVEPWLNTQWQTEKSHILLAEDGHIFLTKFLNVFDKIPEHILHPCSHSLRTCQKKVGTKIPEHVLHPCSH